MVHQNLKIKVSDIDDDAWPKDEVFGESKLEIIADKLDTLAFVVSAIERKLQLIFGNSFLYMGKWYELGGVDYGKDKGVLPK